MAIDGVSSNLSQLLSAEARRDLIQRSKDQPLIDRRAAQSDSVSLSESARGLARPGSASASPDFYSVQQVRRTEPGAGDSAELATRQHLSRISLSLAGQAEQGVHKLFS